MTKRLEDYPPEVAMYAATRKVSLAEASRIMGEAKRASERMYAYAKQHGCSVSDAAEALRRLDALNAAASATPPKPTPMAAKPRSPEAVVAALSPTELEAVRARAAVAHAKPAPVAAPAAKPAPAKPDPTRAAIEYSQRHKCSLEHATAVLRRLDSFRASATSERDKLTLAALERCAADPTLTYTTALAEVHRERLERRLAAAKR